MQTYDLHFLEDPFRECRVTAAMVGISDQRWEHVTEVEASDDVAVRSRMRDKRFDIMPIVAVDRTQEYFVTAVWNDYSTIVRKAISGEDTIPYNTDLREVIRRFAVDQRHFYFLSGPKPVVGLISIVNLNCRQVKVFLFNLIAELELDLTGLVDRHISEAALLAMSEGHKGDFAESRNYYEKDKSEGVEAPFLEYLTLSTLINIVSSQGLYKTLGYTRTRFKKLGTLVKLRNDVAHPARSLVTNSSSCLELWGKLQLLEESFGHSRKP